MLWHSEACESILKHIAAFASKLKHIEAYGSILRHIEKNKKKRKKATIVSPGPRNRASIRALSACLHTCMHNMHSMRNMRA